jgi:acetylornithine deacetylase/succinyl-diaminopimelate desuccinylase-like protein
MMSDISMAVDNDAFMFTLQMEEPWQAVLLSNTCSLTKMKGSNKINVVPPTAELELDCRLLPDQAPQKFLSELEAIINNDSIEITRIMGFTSAISKTNTPLYKAIENSATKNLENAVLIPSVSTGFTDSHFFRDVGIVSYGFTPFLYLQGEATGVHGNNERISIVNLRRGAKIMTDFLFEFVTD